MDRVTTRDRTIDGWSARRAAIVRRAWAEPTATANAAELAATTTVIHTEVCDDTLAELATSA
jgi:hypothetical protein